MTTPYGPPQNYGPPAQQPQQPAPQNYGPPAQQAPQNYGPPQQQPAPQGYGPPAPLPGQPAQSEDASGMFNGASGCPSINFPSGEFQVWKGGIFTGEIERRQATNFKTKNPETWPSGDPIINVVFEVLSPERNLNDPLDDGRRRFFVKQVDTNIPDSLASVVREATTGRFYRGCQIWVCRTGMRMGDRNERGVWAADYRPPTPETLALLDALPPQGISQQAANEVVAQANGHQAPASPWGAAPPPQNGYQQGPPQQQPAYQTPAPQPQQPAYQTPAQQPQQAAPGNPWAAEHGQPAAQGYPQQPAPQGYGPPQQQPQQQAPQNYGPPQGPPPQQNYGPPAPQPQGQPAQTQNPYVTPA